MIFFGSPKNRRNKAKAIGAELLVVKVLFIVFELLKVRENCGVYLYLAAQYTFIQNKYNFPKQLKLNVCE